MVDINLAYLRISSKEKISGITSDPQKTPLSTEHLEAVLLQYQQEVDAQMTNFQNAMLQLTQELGKNLPQSMEFNKLQLGQYFSRFNH